MFTYSTRYERCFYLSEDMKYLAKSLKNQSCLISLSVHEYGNVKHSKNVKYNIHVLCQCYAFSMS